MTWVFIVQHTDNFLSTLDCKTAYVRFDEFQLIIGLDSFVLNIKRWNEPVDLHMETRWQKQAGTSACT